MTVGTETKEVILWTTDGHVSPPDETQSCLTMQKSIVALLGAQLHRKTPAEG